MTDFFNWSLDLGRWAGARVRVHYGFVIWAVIDLVFKVFGEPSRVVPTLAWLGVLLVVLALHELGHAVAAAWGDGDVEDVLLWPLGNLVGPSHSRSTDDTRAVAAGLAVSGGLAVVCWMALAALGYRMVLSPFGGPVDSGAPTRMGSDPTAIARATSPIWYLGWFGWLNWVVFLANCLPALPFDAGRIVRAKVSRPALGLARDAMIGPWTAHTVAGLLAVVGLLRLVFSHQLADAVTLISLALLIEIIVRTEARMMEDGSFFDDGVFGYDFSEGYTSLESSAAKVRPYRESALKRWRRKRSDVRRQRRAAQFAAEDRRLDEILDKLHRLGRPSLSDEEQRFLVRVSSRIRKRPKDRE